MDKLSELLSLCKNSVYITVNEHRNYYQSVESFFKDDPLREQELDEISEENFQKMVEADTVVEIQFYPDTANGFFCVYRHDISVALDRCIEILRPNNQSK